LLLPFVVNKAYQFRQGHPKWGAKWRWGRFKSAIFDQYLAISQREAQLSPRDPRDTLYQLKYKFAVVRITQTDYVIAWGALSATSTFYCATCIVLYTQRCIRHNYRTASMQRTSVQPILVTSTWP